MTGNVHQKKGGLLYHFSAASLYCMVTCDSKNAQHLSHYSRLLSERLLCFLSVSVIPDTTRLRLAIHPAQIHAIGPTNCTLSDDSQPKKKKKPVKIKSMNSREYLFPCAYRICRHKYQKMRLDAMHRPELAVWVSILGSYKVLGYR